MQAFTFFDECAHCQTSTSTAFYWFISFQHVSSVPLLAVWPANQASRTAHRKTNFHYPSPSIPTIRDTNHHPSGTNIKLHQRRQFISLPDGSAPSRTPIKGTSPISSIPAQIIRFPCPPYSTPKTEVAVKETSRLLPSVPPSTPVSAVHLASAPTTTGR